MIPFTFEEKFKGYARIHIWEILDNINTYIRR